jgi:hypothetical protein
MTVLDTVELKKKLEELKAQTMELQKQMTEIGLLIMLADKYASLPANPLPVQITGAGALQVVENAILRGVGLSKKQRITEIVTDILKDGTRRSSRYLVSELRARGLEIGGFDEDKDAASLSSYLSRNKDFDSNVKAGGWTLRQFLKKAKAADAGSSLGGTERHIN